MSYDEEFLIIQFIFEGRLSNDEQQKPDKMAS